MASKEHEEEFIDDGADYRLLKRAIRVLKAVVEDMACDGAVSEETMNMANAVILQDS